MDAFALEGHYHIHLTDDACRKVSLSNCKLAALNGLAGIVGVPSGSQAPHKPTFIPLDKILRVDEQ